MKTLILTAIASTVILVAPCLASNFVMFEGVEGGSAVAGREGWSDLKSYKGGTRKKSDGTIEAKETKIKICADKSSAVLAAKHLTGRVGRMVAEFDARRKLVVDLLNDLPGVSCITPKGAFYAFPNIKDTGWPAKKLASALLEETGVATIGGPDFGVLGEGYIRLSYANSQENIARALDRMRGFLEKNG